MPVGRGAARPASRKNPRAHEKVRNFADQFAWKRCRVVHFGQRRLSPSGYAGDAQRGRRSARPAVVMLHRTPSRSRRASLFLAVLGLGLARATTARAADAGEAPAAGRAPLYFLNDVDYGSDSEFNPVQATIHLSYDILRNASYQDSPFKMAYATGFSNVAKNLAHPFDAIEKSGGAREFIAHEVF